MAVVLSRQIILTPEEKAVAIEKLREAFAEHQKQKADAAKQTPARSSSTPAVSTEEAIMKTA